MDKRIQQIRNEIDEIDTQLIQIIKKRLELVQKIGHVKSILGFPIYDALREADLIAKKRTLAKCHNISADLIEGILKLLIQESYHTEVDAGFKQINPGIKKIVIVGGRGEMGQLFNKQFKLSGYHVITLDKEDNINDNEVFNDAGLVLIAVPIHQTTQIIYSLPQLPKHCILADITSIKKIPTQAMLKAHQGPVVGLHPMFGPNVKSFANQLIIQCNGRMPKHYQWLLEQIRVWGCRVDQVSPLVHDKAMGYIQALYHFTCFIFGTFLEKEKVDLELLLKFSSPIYRLDLSIIGRLFSQSPKLYADIIMSSDFNIEVINRYIKLLIKQFNSVSKKDKTNFIQQFTKTAAYFGEYSSMFLSETELLLTKPNNAQ